MIIESQPADGLSKMGGIYKLIVQTGLWLSVLVLLLVPTATGQRSVDMVVFVQEGCPHCARAELFLDNLMARHPNLVIEFYDVSKDADARDRLIGLARERGITSLGTPTFYVRDQLLIGYMDDATTGSTLEALLTGSSATAGEPQTALAPAPGAGAFSDIVELPVFGRLSASRVGLPLFTIAIGLVDGFNPCAMWALIYLLSLLVNLKDRKRMLLIAGTFVAVGGLIYFAFIAAWFEVFRLIGLSRGVQVLLGGVAVFAGVINVKDFVAFKRGPSLSIPDAAKPTIYARTRRVLSADNVMAAVIAVAILAALINLVELLCTAGLPALYTQVLSAQELSRPIYYGYLGLYIAAYILDDSIVLAIAVVTMSRTRLQERGGRWLKLLSGAVMVLLGILLLVRPSWLL
jgi:glutaredoxin